MGVNAAHLFGISSAPKETLVDLRLPTLRFLICLLILARPGGQNAMTLGGVWMLSESLMARSRRKAQRRTREIRGPPDDA